MRTVRDFRATNRPLATRGFPLPPIHLARFWGKRKVARLAQTHAMSGNARPRRFRLLKRRGSGLGLRRASRVDQAEPRVTFTGDTFVVTLADGSIPIRGTYKLDPTRQPKTVDWADAIGEDAGKTLLAIYSLEGDRLVFCAAYPGQERPTEFRTRPGQVLRVCQRESL